MKSLALTFCLLLGILILSTTSSAAADPPTFLRTEYKVNPLGIDALRPRLSWQLESEKRGAAQTAYQIQVAESDADLRRGHNILWDSGRVETDRSVNLSYEGPALTSAGRYFWRVRTWDDAGNPSDWSETAWWEMGLLQTSDWEARWIEPALEEDSTVSEPSPMLRREFRLDGDVQSARLYVTSHGVYEMRLNGRRVGDQLFTPGWTSYHHRLEYQTYDVTDLLQRGENALGAVLGDGWYRGFIGFQGNRNQYGTKVALLAQLAVTDSDGRTKIVVRTDDGWRATTGPIRMSDIYNGETYDARLEMPGWSTSGFNDTAWEGVRVADHPIDHLIAPAGPPVRKIQTLKPIAILTTPEGDTVFDMGQNMVGWVRLKAEGPAGTEVVLRHSEVLDKDGNFYTDNLRAAKQTTTFILKGDGEEVFEPHFTFQGFRFVDVDGYPGEPTLDALTGVVIHSDMIPTGHFESSHPLINQLQHNIVWGQKGNFLDVPTDCPQRDERLGWTGDAQVFAPTATFNMDVASFFTRWLGDVAADQTDNGRIPHVVPDVLNAGGATGWADAGVIVPWTLYQRYGDLRILERQYDSMKAWIEYMRAQAAQDDTPYVWDTGFHFGDWLAYSTNHPAYPGATTNTDLIGTAYFAYSTGLLVQTAELLDRPEDAREYAELRKHVVDAFREEFVTERARLSSDSQTAYVLALAFDLLPESLRSIAAQRLADEVNSRGHLTTGFLGTPDLMHVLSENGYNAEAYKLLLRTEYPSWLYPVTMDATTIWERWDGQKPDGTFQDVGMNSFNHYAYGAVGDWLYSRVAGISPLAPGYKRIAIAPMPGGGLTHARARLHSAYGLIESAWEVVGDQFRMAVTVPPNTQASVRLPNARLDAVVESGQALADATGVLTTRQDGADVVVGVGAGRYSFTYATDSFGNMSDDGREEVLSAETKLAVLLADADARSILAEHLPSLISSAWLSQTMGYPLTRADEVIPVEIPAASLAAVDRDLRQLER